MRKKLSTLANRIALMGAVAVVALLMLGDPALWHILVPMWLVVLVALHLAMQHLATRLEAQAPRPARHPLLQLLARTEPDALAAAPAAEDAGEDHVNQG
jgi:hypothetical protein